MRSSTMPGFPGKTIRILLSLLVCAATAAAAPTGFEQPEKLSDGEAAVTIVGTNDIHGGFEPSDGKDGAKLGGFEWFAGYTAAIRARSKKAYGGRGCVLLLDAGDAAQGTLLSNFSEGVLAASLMKQVGYSAAIPGNHAYDFGPVGWQYDVVVPGVTDPDPLGALRKSIATAGFPFLAANLTRRKDGQPLAELPPYALIPFGKRTICVIGLENPLTARLTPPENIAELSFSDGTAELKSIVETLRLSGKADLFVLTMHEGDGDKEGMKEYLESLPRRSDGQPLLDAVVAGHTHRVNDSSSAGIPYIQSGANGQMFGMIELIVKVDPATGALAVERDKTRQKAGIPIVPRDGDFLGEPVRADPAIVRRLADERAKVEALAGRVLCKASGPFRTDGGRTANSEVGNLIADAMRQAAGTEIAVINSGDTRSGLPAGTVTYEHLFRALPKNLLLVKVEKLPVDLLVKNMERSVRSCGRRGALQVSGLTVEFIRHCDTAVDGEDKDAELSKLTTASGRVLYEKKESGLVLDPNPVSMATTDFVMSGGAGYQHFQGVPTTGPSAALRDAVAAQLTTLRAIDPKSYRPGRYVNRAK